MLKYDCCRLGVTDCSKGETARSNIGEPPKTFMFMRRKMRVLSNTDPLCTLLPERKQSTNVEQCEDANT